MRKLIKRMYLLLTTILLMGCHNIMREKELVVNKVETGFGGYKYKYRLEAFPTDQILFSNKSYNVGDTLILITTKSK